MRILFGVHSYKPAYKVGGPIHSVSAVAEGLVRRGHSVTVFTSNWNLTEALDVPVGSPQTVDGVEVWYFPVFNPFRRLFPGWAPAERFSNYNFTPGIDRALREQISKFDVAHTHLPFIYPTLAIGRSAIKAGVPLCYHQRGVFDPARLGFRATKKRIYLDLVERPHLSKSQRLFALTEAEASSYRALGLTSQIEIIPNGVDVSAFGGPSDDDYLKQLGIGATDQVVLFLGRLHPLKGVDALVKAFAATAGQFLDTKLVLAGPDELSRSEKWREIARTAGLGNRVIIPGSVFDDQKRSLLTRADIFCLPSTAEGFSMAILEAMASSTAVLISPGCHFPQAADAGAGLIADTDVASIADGLAALLADRARTAEMGRIGRQLVERRYGWSQIVDRYEGVYRQIIEERPRLP